MILLLVIAMLCSITACGSKSSEVADIPSAEPEATAESEAGVEPAVEPKSEAESAAEPEVVQAADVSPDGYRLVCEYKGARIYLRPAAELNDRGNLEIAVRVDAAQCPENIAVQLSGCTVNGFDISSVSQFMTLSGFENETTFGICTSAMALYGLENYAEVSTGLNVFTFDGETYDVNLPAIAEVEPVELAVDATVSDTTVITPDAPVYDRDGVKIYAVQSEQEMFSELNLLVINETDGDIVAVPSDLEMNGERSEVDYSDYAVSVSAGRSAFAVVMLPNYTINMETYATEKFEVTDWHLDFIINGEAS